MMRLELERRSCPICGKRHRSRRFAPSRISIEALDRLAFASRKMPEYMHWQLFECHDCDLLYADPAPRPDDLAMLYRDADFDSGLEARFASRTYGRFLSRIVPRLPDTNSAVDIGTGDGAFLVELLATGFEDVVGIEPSSAPIEAAAPSTRPLIRQDIFRGDSFAPESLSLITCFQTIEHLADPLTFCRDAWRTLKPGGALFLIGHNRRAISARLLGRNSPIFDIEHLQLFSPTSLRRLLNTSGFARTEISVVYNRYPVRYWVQLFPFSKALKKWLLRFLKQNRIGEFVIPLPAGNIAAIAYKGSEIVVRQPSDVQILHTSYEP
jgi:SAM-dependent methyltransferase